MFQYAQSDPVSLKLRLRFAADLCGGDPVFISANYEMSFNTNLKVSYSCLYCR